VAGGLPVLTSRNPLNGSDFCTNFFAGQYWGHSCPNRVILAREGKYRYVEHLYI
jgi:hypothetical protein